MSVSPRATAEDKEAFRALVPDDERVTVRPMFGSVAGFVNGQMFMGLFAADLFVRLSEPDRERLTSEAGGGPLEPMPGRPMREYVTIPGWRENPDTVRRWSLMSLDYAAALPPKKK